MKLERFIYRGSMPCGCVCAGRAHEPDHLTETAEDVAEFVRAGYIVDRVEELRFTRCEAHKGLSHPEWTAAMDAQRERA